MKNIEKRALVLLALCLVLHGARGYPWHRRVVDHSRTTTARNPLNVSVKSYHGTNDSRSKTTPSHRETHTRTTQQSVLKSSSHHQRSLLLQRRFERLRGYRHNVTNSQTGHPKRNHFKSRNHHQTTSGISTNNGGTIERSSIEGHGFPSMTSQSHVAKTRRRRWDYDENYDWENGGKDYEVPGDNPPRKETKFEKMAKNWQRHAVRYIFTFCFLASLVICCLALVRRTLVKTCDCICYHLKEYRDHLLRRDPMWFRMRHVAEEYGIKLDYKQYEQIKKQYEEAAKKYSGNSQVDLSGNWT